MPHATPLNNKCKRASGTNAKLVILEFQEFLDGEAGLVENLF